jgi:Phospholipase_D-nuclease N-terminal
VAGGISEGCEGMDIQVGGFFGLLVLIADVWAIVNVFGSPSSNGAKVAWTILILLLPILGFIIWLIAGPRSSKA